MAFNNRNQENNWPQARSTNFRNNNQNGTKETADEVFNKLEYQSSWITKEATESLVKYAETAGKFMAKNGLTNSKNRSIYGEIKRVQMGVFEKEKSSFYLLKPKVAYALGRDDKNEGLKLFKKIFDRCSVMFQIKKVIRIFVDSLKLYWHIIKRMVGKINLMFNVLK